MATTQRTPELPAYHQIARQLQSRLYHGAYPPGTAIPSANELSELFGVSRLTVRQALRQLVDQGLLIPRRGTGTFVAERKVTARPVSFVGYLDDLVMYAHSQEIDVLKTSDHPAGPHVAAMLDVTPQSEVREITRVARSGRLLVSYARVYFPEAIAVAIGPEPVSDPSVIDTLNRVGIVVQSAHQTLSATAAAKPIAQALGVPEGTALMESEFTLNSSGKPVCLAIVSYLGDQAIFTATLVGPSALPTESPPSGKQ